MAHHSCTCCCVHDNTQTKNIPEKAGLFEEHWRILFSSAILFSGIALSMANTEFSKNGTAAFVRYSLAYLPVGLPVLRGAWKSILQRNIFNEFTLVSVATLGALYTREYPEGVAIALFCSLGKPFQNKAVGRTERSIGAPLDAHPGTATVIRSNAAITEASRSIQIGEIIEVKTGERIPLDGKTLGEAASLNTSALTDENMPRTIRKGEEVLAGMIATDKVVRMEVTRSFGKSAFSCIPELVQSTSKRKASTELFIRKLARTYISAIAELTLLIVLLLFLYSLINAQFILVLNDWLYRAPVFLTILCLCAPVASIPLGYFGSIGATSRSGISLKEGNYLDAVIGINTVVSDKTDTLTQGTFEVQFCHTHSGISEERLVQTIISTERNSTHPTAKATTSYVGRRQIPLVSATDITEIVGYGPEAMIDGQHVLVGSTYLLFKYKVGYPQELSEVANTIAVCTINSTCTGYLSLPDALKANAHKAIKDLKALNISNTQILSGDRQTIVTNFAQRLGVAQAYGDLLPDEKVEHIEGLRQDADNRIAFVGDGINDAPVLALNHMGTAMGGLGSGAAIETADVVVQTNQPPKVATTICVGKQTYRVIWQNILLTFGVKLSVLILGTGGLAALWKAVFAGVGVTPITIVNVIRIQKLTK